MINWVSTGGTGSPATDPRSWPAAEAEWGRNRLHLPPRGSRRFKSDISHRILDPPTRTRVSSLLAGPPRLLVARDLAPLGYDLHVLMSPFQVGFMRSQIPSFRLPEEVLNEEAGLYTQHECGQPFPNWATQTACHLPPNRPWRSVCGRLLERPKARTPGRSQRRSLLDMDIGTNWLANVADILKRSQKAILVWGHGLLPNQHRLGWKGCQGVREAHWMRWKPSLGDWEDAQHEDIPLQPAFTTWFVIRQTASWKGWILAVEARLIRTSSPKMQFGRWSLWRQMMDSGNWARKQFSRIAILVWISTTEYVVNPDTSSIPRLKHFSVCAAFGPKTSSQPLHKGMPLPSMPDLLPGQSPAEFRGPLTNLMLPEMGIHECIKDNQTTIQDLRLKVPLRINKTLKAIAVCWK